MVVAIVAVVPTQKQRCFVSGGGIKVGYVAMLRVRVKNPNGKHTRNRDLRHNTALRGPHNAALAARPLQRGPPNAALPTRPSQRDRTNAALATRPSRRASHNAAPATRPSQRDPNHAVLTPWLFHERHASNEPHCRWGLQKN